MYYIHTYNIYILYLANQTNPLLEIGYHIPTNQDERVAPDDVERIELPQRIARRETRGRRDAPHLNEGGPLGAVDVGL